MQTRLHYYYFYYYTIFFSIFLEDCLITDTPPKSHHLDVVKFTEDSLKTPETLNRPNRKRKIAERMGIDDVKLTDVVFSPKVKITPFSKHQHLMETTPSTSLTKTE